MKAVFRNTIKVLKRFKLATTLNILSLSIAFATFMVIMMQLDYDYNFDRSCADVFRVNRVDESGKFATISRPVANAFFQSSPHIVAGALTQSWSTPFFFSMYRGNEKMDYEAKILRVEPNLTKVIAFDMYEGSDGALEEPGIVLIPKSLSQRIFGKESGLGAQLINEHQEYYESSFIIGGIYNDFPDNSSFQNIIYSAIDKNENMDEWVVNNYYAYIRLDNPANADRLGGSFKTNKTDITLLPASLPDIHFQEGVEYDNSPKSSRKKMFILLAIAILMVVISGINYTNLNIALAPIRIKGINTQKVLGAGQQSIRLSLILEAMIISSISYLIALGLVYLTKYTFIISLLDASTSLPAQLPIVTGAALVALLTGVIAGLYPSLYVTSFQPALALKGNLGLSPKGRTLRNVLIGVQFIVSFTLAISAIFIYLQNKYMQSAELGYEKDRVIITHMTPVINNSREAFTNEVLSFAGIEEVSYTLSLLASDQYMAYTQNYREQNITFQCLPVDPSFLSVMDISITDGRDFRDEDELSTQGAFIFNEKARHEYDLELNTLVGGIPVIGFIPDIKFASFRTEVTPMAFLVFGKSEYTPQPIFSYIKVKAGTNLYDALGHIRKSISNFEADSPFQPFFFDTVFNMVYEKEKRLSDLITLFSFLAIFISIAGIFGLVVFDCEYRKKEIGIRKVHGSTSLEIIMLFNITYIKILCICFIPAIPIALIVIYEWLNNFAYRTPIYASPFVLIFFVVSFIIVLTVTFQSRQAANENPVKSIQSE